MKVALHLPSVPDMELTAAKAAEVLGRRLGMSRESIDAVGVAVVEACLNAMEHGDHGTLEVRLESTTAAGQAQLIIEVEDHGRGFDPEAVVSNSPHRILGSKEKRGWGLRLIRELMDEVTIDSRPGRTLVRMCKFVEAQE